MTITPEQLQRIRHAKAIASGLAQCPYCELGYEIYTISNDVFKCALCDKHPRPLEELAK
jgi:hypothetical protein